MSGVAAAIKNRLRPEALVVSLAPKITLARLTEMLGGFDRLARVIPNAPSLIGVGYNPIAFSTALSELDRTMFSGLLSPLGDCPEVAESKLEAYAMLVAMCLWGAW